MHNVVSEKLKGKILIKRVKNKKKVYKLMKQIVRALKEAYMILP